MPRLEDVLTTDELGAIPRSSERREGGTHVIEVWFSGLVAHGRWDELPTTHVEVGASLVAHGRWVTLPVVEVQVEKSLVANGRWVVVPTAHLELASGIEAHGRRGLAPYHPKVR